MLIPQSYGNNRPWPITMSMIGSIDVQQHVMEHPTGAYHFWQRCLQHQHLHWSLYSFQIQCHSTTEHLHLAALSPLVSTQLWWAIAKSFIVLLVEVINCLAACRCQVICGHISTVRPGRHQLFTGQLDIWSSNLRHKFIELRGEVLLVQPASAVLLCRWRPVPSAINKLHLRCPEAILPVGPGPSFFQNLQDLRLDDVGIAGSCSSYLPESTPETLKWVS